MTPSLGIRNRTSMLKDRRRQNTTPMLTDGTPLRMILPNSLYCMQLHLDLLPWAQFCQYDLLRHTTDLSTRLENTIGIPYLICRCWCHGKNRFLFALRLPHQIPTLHVFVNVLVCAAFRCLRIPFARNSKPKNQASEFIRNIEVVSHLNTMVLRSLGDELNPVTVLNSCNSGSMLSGTRPMRWASTSS